MLTWLIFNKKQPSFASRTMSLSPHWCGEDKNINIEKQRKNI